MTKRKRWTAEKVVEFCGWDFLERMMQKADNDRDKALIAATFLTGGRIAEVLQLQKHHFDFDRDPQMVVVKAMPRVKCYRKVRKMKKWKCEEHCKMRWNREPTAAERERHGQITEYEGWLTEPIEAYRTFPFPKNEPLVPILTSWINQNGGNGPRLFEIKYQTVYGIMTEIGKAMKTWIPPHWFRAQRASQLAFEYGFGEHELIEFFKWRNYMTAFHYASKGYKGLAAKMVR